MNTAIISGRLVRDPGYNETQNEKGLHKIAKFVSKNWKQEFSRQSWKVMAAVLR